MQVPNKKDQLMNQKKNSIAKRHNPLLWDLIVVLISSLNYGSVHFLTLIGGWNFAPYVLAILAVGIISGLLMTEIEKSVKYGVLSFVLGLAITLGLIVAPPIMIGSSGTEIDAVLGYSLVILGKLLLIGVVVCIFGVFLGWGLNQTLESRELRQGLKK